MLSLFLPLAGLVDTQALPPEGSKLILDQEFDRSQPAPPSDSDVPVTRARTQESAKKSSKKKTRKKLPLTPTPIPEPPRMIETESHLSDVSVGTRLPYSTLGPSPFAAADVALSHKSNHVDAMTVASGGYMRLQAVPVNKALVPKEGRFTDYDKQALSENSIYFSQYADVVITPWKSANAAVAAFAGASGWGMLQGLDEFGNQALLDANLGVMGAVKLGQGKHLTVGAQAEGIMGSADMYRNYQENSMPNSSLYLQGLHADAEFSAREKNGTGFKLWAECVLRPKQYDHCQMGSAMDIKDVSLGMAGRMQWTRGAWFANEKGVSANLDYAATPGLNFGVRGHYLERTTDRGRGLGPNAALMLNLSGTLDPGSNHTASVEKQALRYYGDEPDAQKARKLRSRYTNSKNIDDTLIASIDEALRDSDDLTSFSERLGVKDEAGIVAAAAYIAGSQMQWNYNDKEGQIMNADSSEEIYSRWRKSILTGQKDPMIRCLGAAQMASELVIKLSADLGLDMQAGPVTVVHT
ncbi:MAG: hypothetical protein AABZ44_05400, partial [Elusimicrobiota bacterium]